MERAIRLAPIFDNLESNMRRKLPKAVEAVLDQLTTMSPKLLERLLETARKQAARLAERPTWFLNGNPILLGKSTPSIGPSVVLKPVR